MADTKKKTVKKTASRKKVSEIEVFETSPEKSLNRRIFTRKYLYAVLIALALIGILFTASRFWIIAWVDNKPITKFELYSLLEKRDEGKTEEELIVQRLLLSEGQKQKQVVTDAEVETEIKKIEEQQGGPEQLDQILQMQRLNRADFRKLVELQLLKQKLFASGINITDIDVQKYIEENKASIPANILNNPEGSEAAKLSESAKEQLKQMKVNENFNNWLNENLKGQRVIRN